MKVTGIKLRQSQEVSITQNSGVTKIRTYAFVRVVRITSCIASSM